MNLDYIIKELNMRKYDLESTLEFKQIQENKEAIEGIEKDVKSINDAIELLKTVQ